MSIKPGMDQTPARLLVLVLLLGVLPACSLFVKEDATEPDRNTAPDAEISAPQDLSLFTAGQPITLTGRGTDFDDGNLSGENLVWISDLSGSLGTGSPLSVPGLSAGVHRIRLVVKDSEMATDEDDITLIVIPEEYGGVNAPPDLTIVRPNPFLVSPAGQPIDFEGRGVDPEEGPVPDDALEWRIFGARTDAAQSFTGPIGTGRFSRSDVPPGRYQVILESTDSYLGFGKSEVVLLVYDPAAPCVGTGLALSSNPLRVVPGGLLNVELTIARPGNDPIWTRLEDGPSDAVVDALESIRFDHETDGVRERILTIQARDDAALGSSHTLELAAYLPPNGVVPFRCSIPVQIDIVAAGAGNSPPAVTLVAPASGASYVQGQTIDFSATADDPEEGPLSGTSLTWSSSIDGVIGIGAAMSRSLSAGQHVISITATDAGGLAGSASVTIDVAPNQPPVPRIDSPADAAVFTSGDVVAFRGSASDAEDGAIPALDLVWDSNVDGHLGDGDAFGLDDLSVGTHIVTLTAKDSFMQRGSTSVTIDVQPNAAPTVRITAPADGQTFRVGDGIDFTGTATDPEDGPLAGAQMVWTSHRDGQIGVGESFSVDDLRLGLHTITLTATDSHGSSVTSSVGITMIPALSNAAINGTVSAGGYGFPGITVSLQGPVSRTTQTLPQGVYSFTGLPPGLYTVSISNFPVYLTFPVTSQSVVVGPGDDLNVSFQGSITGEE